MRNEDFDPIMALYDDAAALREIAGKYREEKVGLASLLSMVADCAAMLDDTEGKREDGGVIG
jgi:hypothetical protein